MRQSSLQKDRTVCYLCRLRGMEYEELLSSALYHKYSEKGGFKMAYHISCLINHVKTRFVVKWKDRELLDSEREYLQEYYPTAQTALGRLDGLCSYYQFHRELPDCHLQQVQLIIEKHKHQHLKLHYRNVKRQLNMSVAASTEQESSSQSESSTVNSVKCSCVLCGITRDGPSQCLQQTPEKDSKAPLPETESKALQSIYEEMKGLDQQNYRYEKFMFKKAPNTVKGFESYLCSYRQGIIADFKRPFPMTDPKSSAHQEQTMKSQRPTQRSSSIKKLIQDKLKQSYGSVHMPQPTRLPRGDSNILHRRASAYPKAEGTIMIKGRSNSNERLDPISQLNQTKPRPNGTIPSVKRQGSCDTLPRSGILRVEDVFVRRNRRVVSLHNLHERLPSAVHQKRFPLRPANAPEMRTTRINPRAIYEKLKLI